MADSRRTPEELKNIEFNYFVAFKIDLDLKDPEKILERIKRTYSNPAGDLQSRRLLELKDDVIEIMINDAIYDEEAKEYKRNADGRKQELFAARKIKFDNALSFLNMLAKTRECILPSEINDIVKNDNSEHSIFYRKTELVNEFTKLNKDINIIRTTSRLPLSDYQKLDKQLECVNEKTLYDFLGVTQNASEEVIKFANKNKYDESSKWGGAKLKEKQLYSTLCAFCSKHLEDSARRKMYNQYIVLKEEVVDNFKERKERDIHILTAKEYDLFVDSIKETLKISSSEAEEMVKDLCGYFDLYIVDSKQWE